MKSIIASLICGIALLRTGAADEPLIPAPLNTVLLKIQPGMSTNQVLALLSPSYPKVACLMSDWSGQTGYFAYKLDDRFTLKVSCVMRHSKQLVHDDLLFRRQLTNSVPAKDWGYKIQETKFSDDGHKALVLCLEPGAAKSREFTLEDDGFRRFSGIVWAHAAEDDTDITGNVGVTVTLPDK